MCVRIFERSSAHYLEPTFYTMCFCCPVDVGDARRETLSAVRALAARDEHWLRGTHAQHRRRPEALVPPPAARLAAAAERLNRRDAFWSRSVRFGIRVRSSCRHHIDSADASQLSRWLMQCTFCQSIAYSSTHRIRRKNFERGQKWRD